VERREEEEREEKRRDAAEAQIRVLERTTQEMEGKMRELRFLVEGKKHEGGG
jgi:hypothetical protein